jgi:hypothetical protein
MKLDDDDVDHRPWAAIGQFHASFIILLWNQKWPTTAATALPPPPEVRLPPSQEHSVTLT